MREKFSVGKKTEQGARHFLRYSLIIYIQVSTIGVFVALNEHWPDETMPFIGMEALLVIPAQNGNAICVSNTYK